MTTEYAYYIVVCSHPRIPPDTTITRIKLESEADGAVLIERLSDIYSECRDDLKRATLWKISGLSTTEVKNSKQQIYERIKEKEGHPENQIERFHLVNRYFPNGPQHPSGDWVDVVVAAPEILEHISLQGDVDGNLRHMKARVELSRTMRTTGSPTESVNSPAAIKRVVEDPSGPRYGRPSGRFGPPTALFSPELAILRYGLEHLEAFKPKTMDANRAFDLIRNAADFYVGDGERKAVLWHTLRGLLVGESKYRTPLADGSAKPYGVWIEGIFAYLVVEVTNEPGLGGDPFLQGLAVYSKVLAQEKYEPFLKKSNLPVVLVAIAGNCLTVSAAIFTDSIYADKLISIDLHFGSHAADNVLHVARTFMAINECTGRLCQLYNILEKNTGAIPPAKVLWPNPTPYPPGRAEGIPKLEFFSKVDRILGTPINQTAIDEENKRHATYVARMRTGDDAPTTDVFVKFATRYNTVAHRLLADHDPPLAPALYSCTRVVGDMFMVVMEYIPRSEGASLGNLSLPPSALEAIHRDISLALEILHGQDLVFGDLRELNVLYLPKKDRALLVGFDGVGRDGKDRYSACLNPGAGLGVDRLQIMERSHDEENLERLMDRLSRMSM